MVHARNQIISTFHELKTVRYQRHVEYVQSIPCYTLYHRYQGHPPLPPDQLHVLHSRIQQANAIYKLSLIHI